VTNGIRSDHRAGTWTLDEGPVRVHRVKSHPEPFQAVWDAKKSYEVRVDDRAYQEGHELVLREWRPDTRAFTGREIRARIVHKTSGGSWGLPCGLAVLGIHVLDRADTRRERGAA
jgi:hypothetical protein